MTKKEFDFDTWFESLAMMVEEQSGVEFKDEDSVRDDYEQGRNCADVAQEIADEYAV